jgi:hypothetical protein
MESSRAQLLVRPTLDTKFHIDFDWWERTDRELHVFLRSHLCPEHQRAYAEMDPTAEVDQVDGETGEVRRVEVLRFLLATHCTKQPGYLAGDSSLINAVFRLFLAENNTPLSAKDLGRRLGRPAEMILRTLAGPRVYKGIRPFVPL